jgi:hypothetical protein
MRKIQTLHQRSEHFFRILPKVAAQFPSCILIPTKPTLLGGISMQCRSNQAVKKCTRELKVFSCSNKISQQTFFCFGILQLKCNFQCAFDDNESAQLTFLFSKYSGLQAHPFFLSLHPAVHGVGGSPGSFQPQLVAFVMVLKQ